MKMNSYKKLVLLSAGLFFSVASFAQNIVSYQYWFDNNPAGATNVNLSPAAKVAYINTTISTTALSKGYHLVTFQFKDSNGNNSNAVTSIIIVGCDANIVSYEYWLDFDHSTAVSVDVTPTTNLNLSSLLDLSKLPPGTHYISLHFKDLYGNWSQSTLDTISVITGINSPSILNQLELFPTLTSNSLHLKGSLITPGQMIATIYNSAGIEIMSENFRASGSVDHSFDVGSFASGNYYMKIIQGNDYIIKKFIKQ